MKYYTNEARIRQVDEHIARRGLNDDQQRALTTERRGLITGGVRLNDRIEVIRGELVVDRNELIRLLREYNYANMAVINSSHGIHALKAAWGHARHRMAVEELVIHYRVSTRVRGETLNEIRRVGEACHVENPLPRVAAELLVD